jgi:hypothetical protein
VLRGGGAGREAWRRGEVLEGEVDMVGIGGADCTVGDQEGEERIEGERERE